MLRSSSSIALNLAEGSAKPTAHYVMNGGKIYDLKNILGHRNIKMTERYAHLTPDHIRNQMAHIGFSETAALNCESKFLANLQTP